MTAHPCVFQMWRYCHVRILWNVNMFPKLQTRVQCELIVGYAAVNGLGLTQNRRLLNAESLLPCIPRNINSVWIYTCFNASQATYVLQPNIYSGCVIFAHSSSGWRQIRSKESLLEVESLNDL
ncbi:Hypothetical_protein [Hexamita inflata]|uniref:Hypothetical_protein n=1 Tax=Hexamita inflata TaxID=28002 RepID=A0AA86R2J6_9EUKA|nr:Hypothetical protein HINF_LOCUS58189 [Hexamita inflata]